jgi:hypothetical protein
MKYLICLLSCLLFTTTINAQYIPHRPTSADFTTEVSRATSAEEDLQQQIVSETNRSISVDNIQSNMIVVLQTNTATKSQGAKADTALQPNVVTGTNTTGTIVSNGQVTAVGTSQPWLVASADGMSGCPSGAASTGDFANVSNRVTSLELRPQAGPECVIDSISGWGGYQTGIGSTTNNAIVVLGYSAPNATNNADSGWSFFSSATNVVQDKYAYARLRIPPWATNWGATAMVFRVRTSSDNALTNTVNVLFSDGQNSYQPFTNMVSSSPGAWTTNTIPLTNLPAAWTGTNFNSIRPYLSVRGDYFAWRSNYVQWVEIWANWQ